MTSIGIELIPLSPEWIESYRQIAVDTFRQTFDRHNTAENMQAYLEKAYNLPILQKEMDTTRSKVFLARSQGQTVGYLKLNFPPAFSHPVGGNSVELERIYVDAAYKGKGIGEALLQKGVAETCSRSAAFLWLGVWEKNHDAIAFYLKKGFVFFGSHPFFVGDDKQTDLLMRLDLR